MTILERIAAERRGDVERLKAHGYEVRRPGRKSAVKAGAFRSAFMAGELAIIAEVKRRSPSAGELRSGVDPVEQARLYARGGAAAISVLTEPRFFSGSYDDLARVAAAVELPVLCKDFVVDPVQITWAAQAGAAAVLLIAALLDDVQLRDFLEQATAVGLDALVEVHTSVELDRAVAAGAQVIGVNNRDLRTFSVDLQRTRELIGYVPPGVVTVAESGIETADQLVELAGLGVNAVLVGTTLMRSPQPDTLIRSWRRAVHARSH